MQHVGIWAVTKVVLRNLSLKRRSRRLRILTERKLIAQQNSRLGANKQEGDEGTIAQNRCRSPERKSTQSDPQRQFVGRSPGIGRKIQPAPIELAVTKRKKTRLNPNEERANESKCQQPS